MSERLITRDKSIIPSLDISYERRKLTKIVKNTCAIEGIGGYKIGIELVLDAGLKKVTGAIKAQTDLPIIYDHQKAGNDIPDMGVKFANVCKQGGVDAVILFPFTGPKTEETWIKAAHDAGLHVLVGGDMTHEGFSSEHKQDGFISQQSSDRIYKIAAELGVRDFVVPGNKLHKVQRYRILLDRLLGEGNFRLYSPGFVAQGGKIAHYTELAGPQWHAIVGRGIYNAKNQRLAAQLLTDQIK